MLLLGLLPGVDSTSLRRGAFEICAVPLTTRFIEDIPIAPPGPLFGAGLLHPEATILFGQGGIGKGFIAAHSIRRCAEAGIATLILDFEWHEQEWVTRLQNVPRGFIQYCRPDDDVMSMIPMLHEWQNDCDVGLMVVDSVARAMPDLKRGQTEVSLIRNVYSAFANLFVPVLLIAHVSKDDADPPRHRNGPLGSVQWANQARLAWSAIKTDQADHSVEVKCVKANDRLKPVTRTYIFDHDTGETIVRSHQVFVAIHIMWEYLMEHGPMMAGPLSAALRKMYSHEAGRFERIKVEKQLQRGARENGPFIKARFGYKANPEYKRPEVVDAP